MRAEKEWHTYRTKLELAWVDNFEKGLRTNLGDFEGQFFLVTLSPDRKESSHLSDYDRQWATPRSSIVHKSLTSRCWKLYSAWNRRFFGRKASSKIGHHFPMLLCIDDPIVMSGGDLHPEANGPHVHMVIAIQAKHLKAWERMDTAGHLQADAEREFPRGNLNVKQLPDADVAETISYSLKYDFHTQRIGASSNDPLWCLFYK